MSTMRSSLCIYLMLMSSEICIMVTYSHSLCHSLSTRQEVTYKISHCKTNFRQLSLAYVGPKIWNTFITNKYLQYCTSIHKKGSNVYSCTICKNIVFSVLNVFYVIMHLCVTRCPLQHGYILLSHFSWCIRASFFYVVHNFTVTLVCLWRREQKNASHEVVFGKCI